MHLLEQKMKAWKQVKAWKAHSHALCGTILLLIVSLMYMSSNNEFHVQSGSFASGTCQGKRIYMYNLPDKFNTLILKNCSGQIVPWLNFCPHAQNDGFGSAIANHSGWYASDLYMVELVFHRRMMEYPCLVDSMEAADAFYVPYYSGLDALRFLYGSDRGKAGEHGSELVAWLEENGGSRWRRKGGADHFVVTGRTVWDLCAATPGWGTGLLELGALQNVTVLCVEGRTWVTREQAVPYLTSFHPGSVEELGIWTGRVGSAERNFLFAFVGGERKDVGLRQAIIWQCRNSSRCDFLNCGQIKCSHRPVAVMEKLLTAEFCLQPPGDSPTRRSTFDGLIAGCIPVFFRNDSAYQQYTWHLPKDTDSYSVFIPEDRVVHGGLRIEDVLGEYSAERRGEMRENIVGIIPRLVYMSVGASQGVVKDAFDVSLEGVLRRAGQANLTIQ
ncbi:hypothetical protein SUGI_0582760 [Cryptomeria japonica]|uniref:probable xyloglucan galactosyltransferase GT19 n=1 Tax=Cryptomeria japonica TaxID=3369 RepID=UPI0024148981|nr:probable xyloglucan galactosyltransferase GT19 [Cryptomeria japonica]GLJ29546.1 hypothetical protein SUGI_0582760 [Cryptomeria japonica]